MKIISGNSNIKLSKSIAKILGRELVSTNITKFQDHEVRVEINDNVRGEDVFVIQSTSFPCNDNLMELLITIDALSRASASRITAVIPYYGYARQDRKEGGRTPISAKLVANLITVSGAHRVLTVDLHAGQIQGFFDIPTDNLYAVKEFEKEIRSYNDYKAEDFVVVSPDVGGVVRARALAKRLDGAPLAIVDKRRENPGSSQVMNIIGDVSGKKCIIFDDIVDSGGTLCNSSDALIEKGAKSVEAYITHGVLSGKAIENISKSSISRLIITDSIAKNGEIEKSSKIVQISLDSLLAEAIRRIANEESISSIFE